MLKSGAEHLESLRDGRVVYIGKERVDDVTVHPAFRNAAQTIASLYDLKADPAEETDVFATRGSERADWPARLRKLGATSMTKRRSDDDETLRRELEALGYGGGEGT